ncbi:MAG: hypothetical protein OEX02_04960 [Cyclobacteriaceae bacterium]|nr:hypothetical protein [Cyclobacteriaceae bacterium]
MIAQPAEKEKVAEILYHYSHCLTAMDDVKDLIVHKKEIQAINKLKDIKHDLTMVGNWLKELHDQME